MKIWQRHLSARLLRTLLSILASLFCLYVLIDLSIHGVRFLKGKAGLLDLTLYYLLSFSQHFDLFLGLAFLFTILKVLSDLSHHSELIALYMAGLSKRALAKPLFAIAFCLTLLSCVNAQWLFPAALESIDAFRSEHAKRNRTAPRAHAQSVALDDGSELVYQTFDPRKKTLSDIFWLKGPQELWYIKRLEMAEKTPVAHFVDRFKRENGQLLLLESHESLPINDLFLSQEVALQQFVLFENRPLVTLFFQSFKKSADASAIQAHLHNKLVFALLPLLIALSLPPCLLQFSRTQPLFLIAAASIFLLIAFLTLQDGMLILAENRVLPPSLAIWSLWSVSFVGALRQW